MHAFEITKLQQQLGQQSELYLEFLRVPALSVGLYELAAGSVDPQQPHTEDEVYYVVSGQAMIRVGDKDQWVAAGSILYVPAHEDHKFHSITADLSVLVFFAPAEESAKTTPA
jgi:mannose-6-phosphate isomerase-like protein (cupin superfamily)